MVFQVIRHQERQSDRSAPNYPRAMTARLWGHQKRKKNERLEKRNWKEVLPASQLDVWI